MARNSAAEKLKSEGEGGQKFLPPNPLPFCPPERSVSAARSAAISRDFVQKRFELRSVIATHNVTNIGSCRQETRGWEKDYSLLVGRTMKIRQASLKEKTCLPAGRFVKKPSVFLHDAAVVQW